MHVVLLSDGLFPFVVGGIQRHSALLARYLADAGVEMTVFHPLFPDGAESPDWVSVDGATIKLVSIERPPEDRFPGHYVRGRRALSKAMLKQYRAGGVRADFIYAQGLMGLAFVEARKQEPSLPLVGVNLHGYEPFQPAADFRRALEQRVLRPPFLRLARDADLVFSFSGKIREIIERRIGVPAERIVEIPNGINANWLSEDMPSTGLRRSLLFIGRWERRKGIEELTKALLTTAELDFEMHFVGPIPEDRKLPLPHVHYHGTVTDDGAMQQIIDAADCLICPSHSEGMPTVILEAMARGLAVIATDVGATREIVNDNIGILLPDARPPTIDAAIRDFVLWDEDTLQQKKKASRESAAEYTWEKVAAKTIDAISTALWARHI
jgi:glycosyltransferase involved in cell wall biosynthesis